MENSIKITIPLLIVIIVSTVSLLSFSTWGIVSKTYVEKNLESFEQIDVNVDIKDVKYPVINAKNQRIKQGTNFDIKDYVNAVDEKDGDITSKIEFYGSVNTSVKGVYNIRCVIRNSMGLKTVKTVLVLVD